MISWITENVAIGEYSDAINEELLEKEQVDCILSLRGGGLEDSSAAEEIVCIGLGIRFFRVPVNDLYWSKDGDQTDVKIMLRTAAYMLEQLIKKYKRILVHCTAGMDRAPFIVAFYLDRQRLCLNLARAYSIIKEKRPQIIEHYEWI